MDVFLAKLLIQALRHRAKRKLGRRKCRRGGIAAQRGGGASEEQRAALAATLLLVDGLATEREDRLARKRKGRLDVRVRRALEVLLVDVQEWLPDAETCVEERGADVGVWPVCARGAEGGLDFFVGVVGYWECCRLFFFFFEFEFEFEFCLSFVFVEWTGYDRR